MKKIFLLFFIFLSPLLFSIKTFAENRFLVFNKCYIKSFDTYGNLINRDDFYKKRTSNQQLFEKLTDVVLRIDLETNDVRILQKSQNDLNPSIFFGNLTSINEKFLVAVSTVNKNRKIAFDFNQNVIIFINNSIQDSKEKWWHCEPYSETNNKTNSTLKSILKMLN